MCQLHPSRCFGGVVLTRFGDGRTDWLTKGQRLIVKMLTIKKWNVYAVPKYLSSVSFMILQIISRRTKYSHAPLLIVSSNSTRIWIFLLSPIKQIEIIFHWDQYICQLKHTGGGQICQNIILGQWVLWQKNVKQTFLLLVI